MTPRNPLRGLVNWRTNARDSVWWWYASEHGWWWKAPMMAMAVVFMGWTLIDAGLQSDDRSASGAASDTLDPVSPESVRLKFSGGERNESTVDSFGRLTVTPGPTSPDESIPVQDGASAAEPTSTTPPSQPVGADVVGTASPTSPSTIPELSLGTPASVAPHEPASQPASVTASTPTTTPSGPSVEPAPTPVPSTTLLQLPPLTVPVPIPTTVVTNPPSEVATITERGNGRPEKEDRKDDEDEQDDEGEEDDEDD